jgi:hypothetical protein
MKRREGVTLRYSRDDIYNHLQSINEYAHPYLYLKCESINELYDADRF